VCAAAGARVADEAPNARASARCPQQARLDTDIVARAANVNGLVQRTMATTQKPDVVDQARRAAEGTVVDNGGQPGRQAAIAAASWAQRLLSKHLRM